jgi:outer membrane protein
MNQSIRALLLPACAALSLSAHAQAQETATPTTSPWSIALGLVHLGFNTKADVYVGGVAVPGAGIDASSDNVLGLEATYSFDSNWTARLGLGTPVKSNLTGTGSLAAIGQLGEIKGGPATLTMTYSPGVWGPIRAFFGGGMSYMKIFSTQDGAVQNLKVANNYGGVLIVGAEWLLGDGFSLGYTLEKIYLKTTATGTVPAMGNAPAAASVRFDPLVQFLAIRKQF